MWKPRLSLYGQILGWLFLNLALVATVLLAVLRLQFPDGFEALLSGRVGERMRAIGAVMGAELRGAPEVEWDAILERYESAYQVDFLVMRPDGTIAAGGGIAGAVGLPPRLGALLRNGLPRPWNEGPPGAAGPGPRPPWIAPPEGGGGRRLPPEGRPGRSGLARGEPQPSPRPRLLFHERSGDPPRHWAAVGLSLGGAGAMARRQPPDAILVASAPASAGNGVFFDWRPWTWALVGVLAVSALIWLPFVHHLTRRLKRLTAAAESISEGDFAVAVASPRTDELGRLSRAVQRMAQRLDEFVAGQKRFLGDIAHELCSPLARARLSLGILEQRLPPSEQGKLAALQEEVEELSQLVNELLDFSKASLKPKALPTAEVDLAGLLGEIARREGTPDAELVVDAEPGLALTTHRDLLRRAVANVVRNAVRYAGRAGPIRLAARRDGGDTILEVRDRGPGVPAAWLDRIFEPFARPEDARTREAGGTGLGLAIARTCTEALGGSIQARNLEGGGLAVEFRFARAEPG